MQSTYILKGIIWFGLGFLDFFLFLLNMKEINLSLKYFKKLAVVYRSSKQKFKYLFNNIFSSFVDINPNY